MSLAAARRLLASAGGRGRVELSLGAVPGVAVLSLCNPAARNALSPAMMLSLADAVDELERWGGGRGLVLTGAATAPGGPPAFCAGADLGSAEALFSPEFGAAMCDVMTDATRRLAALPLVSVAGIEGPAVGGGVELAMACDYRIMSPSASLHAVQLQRGVTPGWGGLHRLVELAGRKNALFLLGSGARLHAEQAAAFQLADAIVATPADGGGGEGRDGDGMAAADLGSPPLHSADWGGSSAAASAHHGLDSGAPPAPPRATMVQHAVAFLAPFLDRSVDAAALRALRRVLRPGASTAELQAGERAAFLELWGSPRQLELLAPFRRKSAAAAGATAAAHT